ncbi:WSC-domain-containing protein [Mollisia scopiformis]|uniref:WSC-domain-containing protein n=1 Tax=Mollisia scopiformis TaxID=149040 RepID=A0A194XMX4_MOLSC|nr:WSC-domain-containing protein [Mollisia scopiformis]KUJ21127.1 WSC-domain-containing protein [Mollisia scopiformis]
MLSLKSLATASAAFTLLSGVNAGPSVDIVKRNQEPPGPSCTDFTPYVYAGCFQNLGSPYPDTLLYTGPNTQNMTVETCVAFCKGNDYRYAGLEYYSECFCGASVYGPQVDESQCNVPCTGNASETCGANNRLNIYQDPTFPVVNDSIISDYQSIGCYAEGTNGRVLNWRQDQLSTTNMTTQECLYACKDNGYPIAGLEFGQECYCGVVLGNGTTPLSSTSCNMPCTGDSTETCGGSNALNVYVATDLESSQPCGSGGSSSSSSSSIVSSTTSISSSSTSSVVITTSSSSSISSSSSSSSSISSTLSSSSSSTSCTTSTTSSSSSSSASSTSSVVSSSSSSSKSSSSSSSKPASSTSCTTSSTSSTTIKTTTSSPPTTSTTSTKTTASLCTSTYTTTPTPTCEYSCGNWCSTPIPTWTDSNSCFSAVSSCNVQLASCFLHAGFPASLNCFEFSSWCTSISQYCEKYCPGGNCNKPSCTSKLPPSGPSAPSPVYSTSVYTCPAASTSSAKPTTTSKAAASTTSCVPIPTNSNICTQPSNPGKGYTSSSPVGNIPLPCLTCNNIQSDYNSGNCFKLYTYANSAQCPSYPRSGSSGPSKGCKDACDSQYNSCMNVYAQGCQGNTRGDTYSSASQKCQNQWNDCYSANSNVNIGNRCGSFNSGWY